MTTALHSFGIPSSSIPLRAFLNENDFDVFTFGRPPIAIDIMTKVKGLEFNSCFKKAMFYETEGIEIKLIHYQNLILAKQAAGRYKDLNDIEKLEEE